MTWLEIAKRAEEASGPERGLDADAWAASGREVVFYPLSGPWGSSATSSHEPIPKLTASVDAMLSLIAETLPGWYWEVALGVVCSGAGPYWGYVYDLKSDVGHYQGDAQPHPGKTPALALLAAYAEARSAIAPAGEGAPPRGG